MIPIILGAIGAGFLVSAYSEKKEKKFAKGGEIDNEMYAKLDKINDWSIVRKEQFKSKDIYLTLSKSDGYYKISIIANGKKVPKTNVYFTNKQDAEDNFNEKIQKHFEKGDSIPNNYEGKTPEQVWNEWSVEQRRHFCKDHNVNTKGWEDWDYATSFQDLNKPLKNLIDRHIGEGQYAKGGKLSKYKYVPNRDVEAIELNKKGKTVEVDGADVLDGVYVKKGKFAKGGKVELIVHGKSREYSLGTFESTAAAKRYVTESDLGQPYTIKKMAKETMKKEVKKSSGAKKSNPQTGKLKEVMAHAKATRKDGEAWKSAVARAWKEVGK